MAKGKRKAVVVQVKVKGLGSTIKHKVATTDDLSNVDNALRLQRGVNHVLDEVTTEVRRRVGI